MRRALCYPALLIGLPQALTLGFYALMRTLGVPWDVRILVWGAGAALALLLTTVFTFVGLFSGFEYQEPGWLKMDAADARRLREQQEEAARRLDEQIGIPRIPRVK